MLLRSLPHTSASAAQGEEVRCDACLSCTPSEHQYNNTDTLCEGWILYLCLVSCGIASITFILLFSFSIIVVLKCVDAQQIGSGGNIS